jgi:hypothetical protein
MALRLLCVIAIQVFGRLVPLGRGQASKEAEIMVLCHEVTVLRRLAARPEPGWPATRSDAGFIGQTSPVIPITLNRWVPVIGSDAGCPGPRAATQRDGHSDRSAGVGRRSRRTRPWQAPRDERDLGYSLNRTCPAQRLALGKVRSGRVELTTSSDDVQLPRLVRLREYPRAR